MAGVRAGQGVHGAVFDTGDWLDDLGINRKGGPLIAWFTDPAGSILSVLQQG